MNHYELVSVNDVVNLLASERRNVITPHEYGMLTRLMKQVTTLPSCKPEKGVVWETPTKDE
jgi:hypothetical protein